MSRDPNALDKDFSVSQRRQFQKKRIRITSLTYIPGEGEMPWANGETGYVIDNDGTCQVKSYLGMLQLLKK